MKKQLKSIFHCILIGCLLGVLGTVVPFISSINTNTISWLNVLILGLFISLVVVAIVTLIVGVVMISLKKRLPLLDETKFSDEESNAERQLNIKLSHVIIWQNISMVILLSILCLSTLYDWNKVLWLLGLDLLLIVLVVLSQVYAIKLYNKLRGTKVSVLQDKYSLMANGMQMDEGELQVEKDIAYEIFVTLSTSLIPVLYVVIFFVTYVTKTSPILAVSVLTIIYLYINIAQFKTVRNFFK